MKRRLSFCFLFIVGVGVQALFVRASAATERAVSFKTEDGRTIYATLSMPDKTNERVPIVVLLSSKARAAFGVYGVSNPSHSQYSDLVAVITGRGVATLSLDFHGFENGKDKKQLSSISKASSKLYLDVRATLAFLATQPDVDSSRLGIVAETVSAEEAAVAWARDSRVKAMSLISGRLSAAAMQRIAESPQLPLLLVVSSEDKRGFADMTDAYFSSKSSESNIEVYYNLGIGRAMFSGFQERFPKERPLQETIGNWIADQVLLTGRLTEVSFQTEDGWTIYGNLRWPQGVERKTRAVVLLHSGLSDRYAFSKLEVALAKGGLTVLNIDWRGKGKSIGKGKYFQLTKAERDKGYLDCLAAVNFLASQPYIDASRIGVVGTVLGAKYGMAAAVEEPRIKTAVVLTGYVPNEKEKKYIITNKPPILYVTSRGHRAVTQTFTELYNLTKDKGSELIIYDGGVIGYELLELDDDLLAHVVRWMKEKLSQ